MLGENMIIKADLIQIKDNVITLEPEDRHPSSRDIFIENVEISIEDNILFVTGNRRIYEYKYGKLYDDFYQEYEVTPDTYIWKKYDTLLDFFKKRQTSYIDAVYLRRERTPFEMMITNWTMISNNKKLYLH